MANNERDANQELKLKLQRAWPTTERPVIPDVTTTRGLLRNPELPIRAKQRKHPRTANLKALDR